MYGPGVFAVLTPWRERFWGNTNQAFGHPHNEIWWGKEAIVSRGATPALSSTLECEQESVNRLIMEFKDLIYSDGIQQGTDEGACHVLLKFPDVKAVSALHAVIFVGSDNTVRLEDRFSTYGTRVIRDGQVEEGKVHGNFILADQAGLPDRWNEVVVVIGNLAYTIAFPNHATGSDEYLEELETFRQRETIALPLFDVLNLHSKPNTAAPSQLFTPQENEKPIYLDVRKLASSSCATIRLVLNTRDRRYYVRKTITTYPRPPQVQRKKDRDKVEKKAEDKEKEAHKIWFEAFRCRMNFLKITNHPNILPVVDYGETPNPYYIMPYYKHGSLEDLREAGISEEVRPRIFLQLLLGLREFHKLGFAHRDVKEQNILVDDNLTLVFGDPDFVKSENDDALKTVCGSSLYAAPEIWYGESKSYGVSVDIWSLAVCILRLFYHLKELSDHLPALYQVQELEAWNSKWYEAIFEQLDELDRDNDQIMDILKVMLKLDPEERFTADQCLRRGCENGLFTRNRFGDIVLATATEVITPTGCSFPVTTRLYPEEDGIYPGRAPCLLQPEYNNIGHGCLGLSFDDAGLEINVGNVDGQSQPWQGSLELAGLSRLSQWSQISGLEYSAYTIQEGLFVPPLPSLPTNSIDNPGLNEKRIDSSSYRKRLDCGDADLSIEWTPCHIEHAPNPCGDDSRSTAFRQYFERTTKRRRATIYHNVDDVPSQLPDNLANEPVEAETGNKASRKQKSPARCEARYTRIMMKEPGRSVESLMHEHGFRGTREQRFFLQKEIQYFKIENESAIIYVRSLDFWINISNIWKVSGQSRHGLEAYRKSLNYQQFTIVRGGLVQGTYTDASTALSMCAALELHQLHDIITRNLRERGYSDA